MYTLLCSALHSTVCADHHTKLEDQSGLLKAGLKLMLFAAYSALQIMRPTLMCHPLIYFDIFSWKQRLCDTYGVVKNMPQTFKVTCVKMTGTGTFCADGNGCVNVSRSENKKNKWKWSQMYNLDNKWVSPADLKNTCVVNINIVWEGDIDIYVEQNNIGRCLWST